MTPPTDPRPDNYNAIAQEVITDCIQTLQQSAADCDVAGVTIRGNTYRAAAHDLLMLCRRKYGGS